jgi:hypothetical protein
VTVELASNQANNVRQRSDALPPVPTLEDVRMVAPALARYTQGTLLDDLWRRPDLSPRDRSIVTLLDRHTWLTPMRAQLCSSLTLLLLFVGIHNAWDAVTYHVFVKKREQREAERHR